MTACWLVNVKVSAKNFDFALGKSPGKDTRDVHAHREGYGFSRAANRHPGRGLQPLRFAALRPTLPSHSLSFRHAGEANEEESAFVAGDHSRKSIPAGPICTAPVWSGHSCPLPLTLLCGSHREKTPGMCMRTGKGSASAVPPIATQDAGFSP